MPTSFLCWEDYLERMRSDFDSQLLLFRQMKSVCAGPSRAAAGETW